MENEESPIGKLSKLIWSQIPEGKYKRIYSHAAFSNDTMYRAMFNDLTGYWQKIADNVKEEKGEYPDWWQKLIDERDESTQLHKGDTKTN